MLVLSRLVHEKIVIGSGADAITVMVVDVFGGKVRIGIEAPPDVPIHRMEIYKAIHGNEPEKSPQHGAKS